MQKERVDTLLVQQGLAQSRERAKRLIMAGQVYDENQQRYDKPGEKIPVSKQLRVKGETLPYVSRGGLKLEKALASFDVSVKNRTLLDIGASTGGFTDCALQHGALFSYALDVGYNQLAYQLRVDERVEVMERQNFRYSQRSDFKHKQPDIASIDVSFISLKLILPPLKAILTTPGDVLALIKPQFEAGRDKVGKKGIVSSAKTHQETLVNILTFAESLGYVIKGLTFSPITGGEGNIEFLAHLQTVQTPQQMASEDLNGLISQVVNEAHQTLKGPAKKEG